MWLLTEWIRLQWPQPPPWYKEQNPLNEQFPSIWLPSTFLLFLFLWAVNNLKMFSKNTACPVYFFRSLDKYTKWIRQICSGREKKGIWHWPFKYVSLRFNFILDKWSKSLWKGKYKLRFLHMQQWNWPFVF